MANVNVQDQLNDNKDFLEKKPGSLSAIEKGKLESMRSSTDVIENAKKTILNVKAKDGSDIQVTAENLMKAIADGVPQAEGKNYKMELSNANIMIGDKEIDNSQFGRGSELMAFLQVAAGGNLVPDGKFGRETAAAFSFHLSKIEAKQNATKLEFEKVNMNEISTHNFYSEFVGLFGEENAKMYKDKYKAFKATNGTLNCTTYNGVAKLSYTSAYNATSEYVSFKLADVQKTDLNIDNEKLLKTVKSMIENNEKNINENLTKKDKSEKVKQLEKSVETGVKNVAISKFTSPLMQEYIKAQKLVTEDKIALNTSVIWGYLTITIPGKGKNEKLSWPVSNLQKDNLFSEEKFVNELTDKMTPLAKEWKKEQYAKQYEDLEMPVSSLTLNLSTDYIENTKDRIKSLEKLSNQIQADKNVSGEALVKKIDASKSGLEAKLSYLNMKQGDKIKVSGFEKFLNVKVPKTAGERLNFENEVNDKKGEYKIFRDGFNDRKDIYAPISSTDRSDFDNRLKKIDKLYGYNN